MAVVVVVMVVTGDHTLVPSVIEVFGDGGRTAGPQAGQGPGPGCQLCISGGPGTSE